MIDFHTAADRNKGRSLWSGRKGRDQELLIIADHPLRADSTVFEPGAKRFPRTLSQRGMVDRIVDLIQVFGYPLVEISKCPGSQPLGIN